MKRIVSLTLLLFVNPAFALPPEEIAEMSINSTVLISITTDKNRQARGTGFVVGDAGEIVTNYHVIEKAINGNVKLIGKNETHSIKAILNISVSQDLAVIRADSISSKKLVLGDSDKLRIGQRVYAVGNPSGLYGTFSEGIISSIRPEGRNLVHGKVIQITAPISSGSSGGPLLNTDGEVIGIIYGNQAKGQNLNFAIPSNTLKKLLEQKNRIRRLPLLRSIGDTVSREQEPFDELPVNFIGDKVDHQVKLARNHYKKGQYRKAIQYYTHAINLKPKSADLHFERGKARWALGSYNSIVDFNKAARYDKNHVLAYYYRGIVKYKARKPAEAKRDFQRASWMAKQQNKQELWEKIQDILENNF